MQVKVLSYKHPPSKIYKRIYHYHIRKTGGTSLNQAFLSLSGHNRTASYNKLVKSYNNRVVLNNYVYVGWNKKLLEKGNYYYGFSHTPKHKISIPPDTYTISIIRDPFKKILSHYQMLLDFRKYDIQHPARSEGEKWLGESFSEFLTNIPKKHLLSQLYMFSAKYDINEALDNIKSLSCFFLTEQFNEGISIINKDLGITLSPLHIRKSVTKAKVTKKEIDNLKEFLESEIKFYEKVKKYVDKNY
jgi:hypothetical protein